MYFMTMFFFDENVLELYNYVICKMNLYLYMYYKKLCLAFRFWIFPNRFYAMYSPNASPPPCPRQRPATSTSAVPQQQNDNIK